MNKQPRAPKLPTFQNKCYGVQNKYDPNDVTWYDTYGQPDMNLRALNVYILVEGEADDNRYRV